MNDETQDADDREFWRLAFAVHSAPFGTPSAAINDLEKSVAALRKARYQQKLEELEEAREEERERTQQFSPGR